MLPEQIDHLTQWLLKLNDYNPQVLLKNVGGKAGGKALNNLRMLHGGKGGGKGLNNLRSLLVSMLKHAENDRQPACTVGSVIRDLLLDADMATIPAQLGLAPERLIQVRTQSIL